MFGVGRRGVGSCIGDPLPALVDARALVSLLGPSGLDARHAQPAFHAHQVGLERRRLVALHAERAAQLARLLLRRCHAARAHDHRHAALAHAALVATAVHPPRALAHAALRFDLALQRVVRLELGLLLLPLVEEVVLPLPEPALWERLQVPLDAAAHLHGLAHVEARVALHHLVEQRTGALAADAAGAVEHDALVLQLLPRFPVGEPLGPVARVAHLGVDERGAALRWLEVADGALIRVAHIDDHRVALLHLLVVLQRVEVHAAVAADGRRLLVLQVVVHELILLVQRE